MSRLLAVAAFLAVGACAGQSSRPTPAVRLDGIYSFSESQRSLTKPIEGTMTVLGDTIMVDAQPGPCRYDEKVSWGSSSIVYRCAEMTLALDRKDPVRNSKFHTTVTVEERQSVCVRYETNPAGQRVCAQRETQLVSRNVEVSGVLHPSRVEKSIQP